MQPKSFSATAMQTAEQCLARYKAENIDYARGITNTAASLGTAVHAALEQYVKAVYIDKNQQPDEKFLLDLFRMNYMTVFNTLDLQTVDYYDGHEMLHQWFLRTSFEGTEVVSCEVKSHFMIPTSVGEIPFNYIWDRFDKIDEGVYKVVDYKTIRWGFAPDELKDKIQARAYALAAQIQQPDAKRIWVHFDLLRHGGPVGIVFTRDQNIATWKFLKELAQKIVDTPEDSVTETLNPSCLFCVRKQSCKALLANVAAGGIMSISHPNEAVDRRAQLEFQKKAITSALQELDSHILSLAKELDEFEFESDTMKMRIGVRSTRAVDPEMAEMVLPSDVMKKYSKPSFTMANVDKLLKGQEIDEATKKQLAGLIYQKTSEPSVKTEAKGAIGDD